MSVWKSDETLLSICILNFSFKNDFVWEEISNIRRSVSSPDETPRSSSKILRYVFSTLFSVFHLVMKHCVSCLIYYLKKNDATFTISHAGHHHEAKFSGKSLCIHPIFTVKHNIWPCPQVELPRLKISKHVSQNVGVMTRSDGLLRKIFVNHMIPEFFHRQFGRFIQGGT